MCLGEGEILGVSSGLLHGKWEDFPNKWLGNHG